MPSIAENEKLWGAYDWSSAGNEWSEPWGTAQAQWMGCLYPRVFPFLRGRILEIAPGWGRWTQFLRHHCSSLIGVDLIAACVHECRRKFANDPHLKFEVGNGYNLPMVETGTIDFAFSFDSLVHAEADVLESYASELARVLKPNAVAFLHHSNLAAEHSIRGRLKRCFGVPSSNPNLRARSMSARAMREFAECVDMSCIQQELIPWGSSVVLIDCMSMLINAPNRSCVIVENRRFREEAAIIKRICELAR